MSELYDFKISDDTFNLMYNSAINYTNLYFPNEKIILKNINFYIVMMFFGIVVSFAKNDITQLSFNNEFSKEVKEEIGKNIEPIPEYNNLLTLLYNDFYNFIKSQNVDFSWGYLYIENNEIKILVNNKDVFKFPDIDEILNDDKWIVT